MNMNNINIRLEKRRSNGAITASYIAAYGGKNIAGAVLEDPPIFSTGGEGWKESFAYLDTYKPLHDYNESSKKECWEAYYLRNCHWGKLFMKSRLVETDTSDHIIHTVHSDVYISAVNSMGEWSYCSGH